MTALFLRKIFRNLGAFFLGVIATMFFVRIDGEAIFDTSAYGTQLRDGDTPYHYIKPLLACSVGAGVESPSLTNLHETFVRIVDEAKRQHQIVDASIFFAN